MKTFSEFRESAQTGSPQNTRRPSRTKAEEFEVAKRSTIRKVPRHSEWDIATSVHAAAQSSDRHREYTPKHWMDLHSKVLSGYNAGEKKKGEHLFFSKSHNAGYIAHVDPEKKKMHIITVLPKGKANAKEGTHKLVVEGVEFNIVSTIFVD